MSREILFKAKRIDNGEWVEGYVFDDGFADSKRLFVGGLVIMDYKGTADDRWNVGTDFYEVNPDTLCQYTGLTDKNGNKIWENDVVECKNDESHFQSQIEWDKSYCGFILQDSDTSAVGLDAITKGGIYKDVQVIGNIFDNPELIECEV